MILCTLGAIEYCDMGYITTEYSVSSLLILLPHRYGVQQCTNVCTPPISLLSLFFCRDCAYTLDRVQYFDLLIWGFLIRKIVILLFCYCVSLIQNVPFLSN